MTLAEKMTQLLSCRLALALAAKDTRSIGVDVLRAPVLGDVEYNLLRLLVEDAIEVVNEVDRLGVPVNWLPLALRDNLLIPGQQALEIGEAS